VFKRSKDRRNSRIIGADIMPVKSVSNPLRNVCLSVAVLCAAALLLLLTVALFRQGQSLAQAAPSPGLDSPATGGVSLATSAPGDPLPRIQCVEEYTATVYAVGLSAPDGLAFSVPGVLTLTFGLSGTDSIFTVDPATGDRALFANDLLAPEGLRFSAGGGFPLYVAEEDVGGGAGRLSRIEPDGSHAPFCTGFFSIEDVAVDQEGWLYVSEDASGLIILIRSRRRVWLPVVMRQEESMPGAFAALEKGEILR
jgi:glucose/arabinose dehydrogenase